MSCDKAKSASQMDWNVQMAMRQPWSWLLKASTPSRLESKASDDSANPGQWRRIAEQVGQRDLCEIADFLSQCPGLSFFFIGWDRTYGTMIQRCGPSRRKVCSLLKGPKSRRRGNGRSSAGYDQVYYATGTLLDELQQRDAISFVLAWRLPDNPSVHFNTSADLSREAGWRAIWLSLPADEAGQIREEPPPSASEVDHAAIVPASPTVLEPDPAVCHVPWHTFQQYNPMRRPDWRWNRAHALVQYRRNISRTRDDYETGHVVRFLRKLLESPQDTESVKAEFPELFAAHFIYVNSGASRVELECRILARESPEEISAHLSVVPRCVEIYSSIFFDVRDRLDAKTYIWKQILEPVWAYNTPANLLMSVAYYGGPHLLEAVFDHLTKNIRVSELLRDGVVDRLALLAQCRQLPQDGPTAHDLVCRFSDLIGGFPRPSPDLNLIGVFSQIASPFRGILQLGESVMTSTRAA